MFRFGESPPFILRGKLLIARFTHLGCKGAFAPRKNTAFRDRTAYERGVSSGFNFNRGNFRGCAETSGLFSPATRNNYFRWHPTRRTRNSFSLIHIWFAHMQLTEMELLSLWLYRLDYQEHVIRSACCIMSVPKTAAIFQYSSNEIYLSFVAKNNFR